jgi:hypothetical protein
MKTFKSCTDVEALSASHPAYPVMKELVTQLIDAYTYPGHPYNADDYGYCVLLEEGDLDGRNLPGLGSNLLDVLWEGAFKKDGFYVAIFLWNDDAGMTVTIPDAPWVNGDLRKLLDEMVAY